jgi:NitT/TauT family transport system substrate-binding protein
VRRRDALALATGLLVGGRRVAHAQEATIGLGFTTGDSVAAFAALDQGIFARRGLDVRLSYVGMNSNMPAALVSDSLQIDSTTVPVFLRAVDNGIDLVAVAGATEIGPDSRSYTVLVRPETVIDRPADLSDKIVAVPGLGAMMHVLLMEWLRTKGVDPASVHFVEATFMTMPDLLHAGTVDAVASMQPFTARMVAAGIGRVATGFVDNLPGPMPSLIYVTTRAWAHANPEQARELRGALTEGADWANAHPDGARASIAIHTKMPAAVLASLPPPVCEPSLAAGFNWLAGVMLRQGLLRQMPDPTRLIAL